MVNKLWPANRKEGRHLGAAAYVWRRDYKIKVEPKKTQMPEEGFLRGQNKRTGLVFNINSSRYVRATGASFPFPVCICDVTQCNAGFDLFLHTATPRHLCIHDSSKGYLHFFCDLCLWICAAATDRVCACVRASQSHKPAEAWPGGLHSSLQLS